MERILRADGDIDTSVIPPHMLGYIDDAARVDELKEQSRLTLYDSDSSGSDHSDVTLIARETLNDLIQTRATPFCQTCATKKATQILVNQNIWSRADQLVKDNRRVFNAHQLQSTRKQARLTKGIIEVLPGWFTTATSIQTCDDIQATYNFVQTMFSSQKFEEKMASFIAKHPLPCTECSPTIQNLRGKHYLSTVLLYFAKKNKCYSTSPFTDALVSDLPDHVQQMLHTVV